MIHKKISMIDIEPKNKDIIKMDVHSLKFRNETFDGVLLSHVIEHLKNPVKALKELERVLKPGGKLVIITPAYPPLYFQIDKTHKEEWNPEKIEIIKKQKLNFKELKQKKSVQKLYL